MQTVQRGPSLLTCYVALVSVAGLGVMLDALLLGPLSLTAVTPSVLLVALFLVVAELNPVTFARRGGTDVVSLSGAFACALLLLVDWQLAVAVQAGATLLDDLVARVRWWKTVFNVGQHVLAVAAAGSVLAALGGSPSDSLAATTSLLAALAACLVFFAVNHVLPGAFFALQEREPVLRSLAHDLPFQLSVNGVVIAMAPLVVAVADDSPLLLALLVVPVLAVHRGAMSTLERDRVALHDSLTGLPNQLSFRRELADELAASAGDRHLGVMVLSLDHFGDVNHTLGHVAADQLLCQVADRLRGAVPEGALVARLEAGSFLVALPGLASPWEASACAEKLLQQFSDPYAFAESAFALRASIGLTVAPLHGNDPEHLVQHAEVARDVARRSRSGLEVYSAERNDFTERRLTVLRGLGPALRRREMAVHFQPQVELSTGVVHGYEALLRWEHPQLGTVGPDEFVPLAEHAGMMRAITDFVLDEALHRLADWRRAGSQATVSVNVSASVLQDPDLPIRVARRLALWGVPSSALVLELTETAVLSHPERCQEVMRELRALNVGLSLDDYGTGYASLAYLTTLPVDEVKIDKSFVMGMLDNRPDRLVVRSTLELARELGLRVVAEGVEDAQVAAMLAGFGCQVVQGYLFGRPLPPSEIVVSASPPVVSASPPVVFALPSVVPVPPSVIVVPSARCMIVDLPG